MVSIERSLDYHPNKHLGGLVSSKMVCWRAMVLIKESIDNVILFDRICSI
ncbi:MAG: hypothetical protein CM15mP83_4670 [Flavobacteriaceae bacterium]|nr:MAG: hypothetical protein CM15mP83_4670 [Flavobacteriaceae bacterium]